MLQARLELAPRVNPDWILSPTRLPIPPLERGIFNCHALSGIGRPVYLPSPQKILNLSRRQSATGAYAYIQNITDIKKCPA